jgi:hypothetical protein
VRNSKSAYMVNFGCFFERECINIETNTCSI